MTIRISLAAAAAALALAAVGPVLAQETPDALPDAPGKEVVLRVCTACHEATQFTAARYTPEEWDNEIGKMQSAGAIMTADEQLAISAYLGKYLSKPSSGAEGSNPMPPPGAQSAPDAPG